MNKNLLLSRVRHGCNKTDRCRLNRGQGAVVDMKKAAVELRDVLPWLTDKIDPAEVTYIVSFGAL
jgi:hypothetical protein